MYVTGNKTNFESRLHQLATSSSVLSSFVTEGNSYITGVSRQASGKWEKEARLSKFRYSHNASFLSQQVFSGNFTPAAPVITRSYGGPNQIHWTYDGPTPFGYAIYSGPSDDYALASLLDYGIGETYYSPDPGNWAWVAACDINGTPIGPISEGFLVLQAILISGAGLADVNGIYLQQSLNSPIYGSLDAAYIDDGNLIFEGDIKYVAQNWPDVSAWEQSLGPLPAPTGYAV